MLFRGRASMSRSGGLTYITQIAVVDYGQASLDPLPDTR
jgi:hypothetical protein